MNKVKSNTDGCAFEIHLGDSGIKYDTVSIKTSNKGKIVYKMKDNTYRITEIKPSTFKD